MNSIKHQKYTCPAPEGSEVILKTDHPLRELLDTILKECIDSSPFGPMQSPGQIVTIIEERRSESTKMKRDGNSGILDYYFTAEEAKKIDGFSGCTSVGKAGYEVEIGNAGKLQLFMMIEAPGDLTHTRFIMRYNDGRKNHEAHAYGSADFNPIRLAALGVIFAERNKEWNEKLDILYRSIMISRREREIYATALPHFLNAILKKEGIKYSISNGSDMVGIPLGSHIYLRCPVAPENFDSRIQMLPPLVKELKKYNWEPGFALVNATRYSEIVEGFLSADQVTGTYGMFLEDTKIWLGTAKNRETIGAIIDNCARLLEGFGLKINVSDKSLIFEIHNFSIHIHSQDEGRRKYIIVEFVYNYDKQSLKNSQKFPLDKLDAEKLYGFLREFTGNSNLPGISTRCAEWLDREYLIFLRGDKAAEEDFLIMQRQYKLVLEEILKSIEVLGVEIRFRRNPFVQVLIGINMPGDRKLILRAEHKDWEKKAKELTSIATILNSLLSEREIPIFIEPRSPYFGDFLEE